MNKEQVFRKRRIILQILSTSLILLNGFAIAFAQELSIETKTLSQIATPENVIQRLLMKSTAGAQIGYLKRSDNTLIVALPGKRPVALPYRLPSIISYDGSTIIQFGDLTLLDEPQRFDLFWIDSEGKEKSRLVNYYAGDALLGVSTDGYTAVGGSLIEKPRKATISCYSPDGVKIWETALAQNQRVSQLYTAHQGNFVAAVTTDSEQWLKNHQINIYGKLGKLQSTVKDLGIIQRVVFLGDDSKLFFQGRNFHGMIDAASGRVIWKKSGKVTMVSPYGTSLSPDGKYLFLVVIGQEGRRREPYDWKFMILNASTGKEISSQMLPEKYPATWERIFESIGNDSVMILAGDSRITVTIIVKKGSSQ